MTRHISPRGISFVLLLTPFSIGLSPDQMAFETDPPAEKIRELIECTTGVALGSAARDGRPLLWKNRDLTNDLGYNEEFHYVDNGGIPFISITYAGETDEYFGGVNAQGFAIENSNSYNMLDDPGVSANGWTNNDDDGFVQAHALATCSTVDDFQSLLDSTNFGGRTHLSNYGVIDAYGGAAIFETGGHSYFRHDAVDEEDGFLIRANYSYSGQDVETRYTIEDWGPNRHDQAYRLFKSAVDRSCLTAQYLLQQVSRNLTFYNLDPYPLPFRGYEGDLVYGAVRNEHTIGRRSTRGVLVVEGVQDGENPDDAILWAISGSQLTSIAVPLWVRAGSVPTELDGETRSRICDQALRLEQGIYETSPVGGNGLSTWRLTNPGRTGIWDFTLPMENWVFRKTEQFLQSPNFSYDRLRSFQEEIAQQVADSLAAWKPPVIVNDIVASYDIDHWIKLVWGSPQGEREEDIPDSFSVYRAINPFREAEEGEFLGVSYETEFIDRDPPDCPAFYRVTVHW